MKSFIFGLATIIVLAVIGLVAFRGTTSLMTRLFPPASPTATPVPYFSPAPSTSPTPTPRPLTANPAKTYVPTTKGGVVKGVSTTRTTTTTATTSHLLLTLIKTSTCPISYMTEVKDIQGPLTLKYSLIDNTSFGITIWRADGNELFQNTTFGGNSGQITTISGVDYMKVRIESKTCASSNNNWLTLTAER
jgi:hypothetical protein